MMEKAGQQQEALSVGESNIPFHPKQKETPSLGSPTKDQAHVRPLGVERRRNTDDPRL